MKKGGAAKGELVLAIFELANCFRHGWGIHKDPYAAKQVCWNPDERGGMLADLGLCSIMRLRRTWETLVSLTRASLS